MLLYYIMITENKKEYFKNYRLKNKDKLNEYQRKYYLEKKNKNKVIEENIKKDVEKIKTNFLLLHGYDENDNKDVTVIIFIN